MLFVFDENFPADLVRGLSILENANRRSKIKVDIISTTDLMGNTGFPDEEIIEKASKKDAVIITHDSDFKRIKHYRSLLVEHNVGYVYFKVPKGKYQYWDIVKAFINQWEELKEAVSNSDHPFAFEVSKQGQLTKLSF